MLLWRTRSLAPRQRTSVAAHAVTARWTLDARYGRKREVTELLQAWVASVGSQAPGFDASRVRLHSGFIGGAGESRLELEVAFDSLADWEAWLTGLPLAAHKAWSQRMQALVVDGSPAWAVLHSVPLAPPRHAPGSPAAAAAPAAASAGKAPARPQQLVIAGEVGPDDIALWHRAQQEQAAGAERSSSASSDSSDSSSVGDGSSEPDSVPLDWKGEPMKLNPGDKLPFKFL